MCNGGGGGEDDMDRNDDGLRCTDDLLTLVAITLRSYSSNRFSRAAQRPIAADNYTFKLSAFCFSATNFLRYSSAVA